MPAVVICVSNEKGGSAKTTSVVNLAAAFAEQGKRVLVIDMDPQGNSSYILGDLDEEDTAMYSVLVQDEVTIPDIVQETTTPNLFIAPSNMHLAGAEMQLVVMHGREQALKRKLTPEVLEAYDIILVDTSPSLGLLTVNALTAADYLLIPVSCDFLSLVGIKLLFQTLELCQAKLGSNIRVLGMVATIYDQRERISKEIVAALHKNYAQYTLSTVVRRNVKLKEFPSQKQTIFQYAPTCPGARDHLALANEVLDRMKTYGKTTEVGTRR